MNKIIKSIIRNSVLFSLCLFVFGLNTVFAGHELKTETFGVSGNCGMCKQRIEASLKKKDGVEKKTWDADSQKMTVSFDPEKISLTQIKQKIAAVGYDTDEIKADNETYNKLHGCCQYERKTKE